MGNCQIWNQEKVLPMDADAANKGQDLPPNILKHR
jgi:hypothetical protein